MCIAILNTKKGKEITKEELLNCYYNNPDGIGLFYADRNKIRVYKTLSNFEEFHLEYLKARKLKTNICLHFRIGTSGKKDLLNCHPFEVSPNLYFCHNGIIDVPVPKNSIISDTIVFNETILKNLPDGFLSNKAIKRLIESYTHGSKLLFLDSNSNFTITNEKSGCWHGGNWFSNYSYLYKTISDLTHCEECGKLLITNDEKECGTCMICASQYYSTDFKYSF